MRRTLGFLGILSASLGGGLGLGACQGQVALGGPGETGGDCGIPTCSNTEYDARHDSAGFDAPYDVAQDNAVGPTPEGGEGGPDVVNSEASPPPGPAIYQLTQAKSLASPLPGASGVTYDGSFLWILAATGNPQPYELEQFDPSTVQAKQTSTLPSLFSTLGTAAAGIAWDGSTIWLSVSGDTNSLNQLDPTTGSILRTMSSPAILGPTDLDFDGTDLWMSSGTGDAYRINPATGGIDLHFPIALQDSGRDNGIAWRTGELFVGELFGGMEVYDAATGKDLGSVVHPGGAAFQQSELGPSVFVGGQLVIASSLGLTYYDVAKAQ